MIGARTSASNSTMRIQEEDGNPSGIPNTLKITPNDKLTDNADGSFTLDVSGVGTPAGTVWKDPVLDKDLITPPANPDDGDRYIISAGVSGDWYSEGGTWNYRQKITIDSSKVPSDQSNFPVAIIIDSASNPIFGKARSDGYDILFTASDKLTKLDHELVYYNDSTGSKYVECHVRIPTLSSSSNTDIYMYYGNASADTDPSVVTTWNSSYKMVQHLDDKTTSTTDDSTTNNNDGNKASANNPVETTGKIDKAQLFDGSNDDIRITYNSSLDLSSAMTFEGWIKANNPGGAWQTIIAHSPTAGQYNYWFYLEGNDLKLSIYSSTYPTITANNVINDSNWHHVAFIATSGGTTKIYVDGSEVASGTAGSSWWGSAYITISDLRINRNIRFNGIIDECRLSDSVRNADWITTTYNNQSSPSTFLTFADEEAPSATGDWEGYEQYITKWNASTSNWDMDGPPQEGWACWVKDEKKQYNYDGSNWIIQELEIAHNQLAGLQGGTTGPPTQYYHMTETEHTEATRLATDALCGLMPAGKMNQWDSAWHIGDPITEEVQIQLDKPAIRLHDTDDDSAYKLIYDADDANYPGLALYVGSITIEGTFTPSPANPLVHWDADNQMNVYDSIGLKSQNELRFYDADDSHYSGFKAHSATTASGVYVMPAADGNNNDALCTDGSGNLKWMAGIVTDEKVKVDADATAGYLGAASNDGVLRAGTYLSYTDGGDYITLDVTGWDLDNAYSAGRTITIDSGAIVFDVNDGTANDGTYNVLNFDIDVPTAGGGAATVDDVIIWDENIVLQNGDQFTMTRWDMDIIFDLSLIHI